MDEKIADTLDKTAKDVKESKEALKNKDSKKVKGKTIYIPGDVLELIRVEAGSIGLDPKEHLLNKLKAARTTTSGIRRVI